MFDPERMLRFDARVYLGVILALLLVLLFYNPYVFVLGLIVFVVLSYYARESLRQRTHLFRHYVEGLRGQLEHMSAHALEKLPVHIAIVDRTGVIHWRNSLFNTTFGAGEKLSDFWPEFPLADLWQGKAVPQVLKHRQKAFGVDFALLPTGRGTLPELAAIYLYDATNCQTLREQCLGAMPALALIQIDNYEEVMQGLEETETAEIIGEISHALGEWTAELHGYLKKFAEDKYLLLCSRQAIEYVAAERFDILDRVRKIEAGNRIPPTLSIGASTDAPDAAELGKRAQACLDLALGRGGDQAAVNINGKLAFYGGKTKAVEKSTRVKARVVAHALFDLMRETEKVAVMGHVNEDFDSLGAAIGIAKMARTAGRPGYIVVSQPSLALAKMQTVLEEERAFVGEIVSAAEAAAITDANTLLVIVDAHRPSLVAAPELLARTEKLVVIDHHRRAEDFIANPLLIYIEPYASSTSELVSELLQYSKGRVDLTRVEATMLYAGIIVDTKNFAVQTGVRTFEVASYLRRSGADPGLVRRLFRLDFASVQHWAGIIKNTEIICGIAAVGVCPYPLKNAKIVSAQTADLLLNIEGVNVSFVLCPMEDGINISARSNGDINVQVVMEQLGGGGHLMVAGAQLTGVSLDEARAKVVELIQAYCKEGKEI